MGLDKPGQVGLVETINGNQKDVLDLAIVMQVLCGFGMKRGTRREIASEQSDFAEQRWCV
jgi:hypothetical protein